MISTDLLYNTNNNREDATPIKAPLLPLMSADNVTFNLHMTKSLIDKIKYLCNEFPSQEWSGVLFYTAKGDIQDIENLNITAFDLYPLDLGSGVYTEFAYTPDYAGYLAKHPELMDSHTGLIHSHNAMQVFFSGTDTNTLKEQAPLYKFFLSVIINNKLNVEAALAIHTILATTKTTELKYTGFDFNAKKYLKEENKVEIKDVVWKFGAKITKEEDLFEDLEFKQTVNNLKTDATKQSFKSREFPINTPDRTQLDLPFSTEKRFVPAIDTKRDTLATTFVCALTTQNYFKTINTKESFKNNFNLALMSIPKDLDLDKYTTILEDSIDSFLCFYDLETEEDIVNLLSTAEELLIAVEAESGNKFASIVYETILSTLMSYTEEGI